MPMLHPRRREKNGQLQRPSRKQMEEAQQNLADAEKSVVLAQSHRNGSKSERRENALGRFVEDYRGDEEWILAGDRYFGLVHRWRVLNDVPEELRLREGAGAGEDVTRDEMLKLKERIKGCDRAMKRSAYGPMGELAFQVTQAIILDSRDPHPSQATSVKLALVQLTVELGFT